MRRGGNFFHLVDAFRRTVDARRRTCVGMRAWERWRAGWCGGCRPSCAEGYRRPAGAPTPRCHGSRARRRNGGASKSRSRLTPPLVPGARAKRGNVPPPKPVPQTPQPAAGYCPEDRSSGCARRFAKVRPPRNTSDQPPALTLVRGHGSWSSVGLAIAARVKEYREGN